MDVLEDIREEALKIWRRIDEEKERYPADIIAQAFLSERLAQKERDAKIAEAMPEMILEFWERPNGPPGNGYRPTAPRDVAVSIRQS